MSQRITGLETEYGCLIQPPAQVQDVLPRVRDWLFDNDRYGLIDLHDRDWDEPAGNGGFLFNGGPIYIDMGPMEYSTPECAPPSDGVGYDRPRDMLLQKAVDPLRFPDQAHFIRNKLHHH